MSTAVHRDSERLNPYQPQKLQSLLMKPDVQVELEIDRSTFGLVSNALSDVHRRLGDIYKGVDLTLESDPETLRARIAESNKLRAEIEQTTEAALTEIFPPKKYERLKQIALRIQVQDAGLGKVLLNVVLAEEMQFSEAQLETMHPFRPTIRSSAVLHRSTYPVA